MSVTVVWERALPPVNQKEVMRYAGVREADAELLARLSRCEEMLVPLLAPRACYGVLTVDRRDGALFFGNAHTDSAALQKSLRGCDEVLLLGATLGLDADRLIARQATLSPATALLLDALAAERIEALCDVLCARLAARYAAEGARLCPRFSPGYGDLPLSFQKELFSLLELPKSIGLSLNESLMMSPQKSVTALMGIQKEPRPAQE